MGVSLFVVLEVNHQRMNLLSKVTDILTIQQRKMKMEMNQLQLNGQITSDKTCLKNLPKVHAELISGKMLVSLTPSSFNKTFRRASEC